jgi:hypothetical protein
MQGRRGQVPDARAPLEPEKRHSSREHRRRRCPLAGTRTPGREPRIPARARHSRVPPLPHRTNARRPTGDLVRVPDGRLCRLFSPHEYPHIRGFPRAVTGAITTPIHSLKTVIPRSLCSAPQSLSLSCRTACEIAGLRYLIPPWRPVCLPWLSPLSLFPCPETTVLFILLFCWTHDQNGAGLEFWCNRICSFFCFYES